MHTVAVVGSNLRKSLADIEVPARRLQLDALRFPAQRFEDYRDAGEFVLRADRVIR